MNLRNWIVAAAGTVALAFSAAGCAGSAPIVPGMTHIEPGKFKMGYDKEGAKPDEKPVREVSIDKGYYIDKNEVTNRQYAQFLKEVKRQPPSTWKSDTYPDGQDELPVTGVTYEDAKAYAEKMGKRLPTAAEWEYAARGPTSKLYPWGNDWAPGKCNSFEAGKGGPVKVGEFKDGRSWSETYDQSGNVWEWTSTGAPGSGNMRFIKGGSFALAEDRPRASVTGRLAADQSRPTVGFRCAKDEE